ncbi:MAG: hypothetical protein O3A87_08290 [Verrucomicrobia bacterium]|nr:hypothetical protein [Verrucomicrobiota bacterium]MDA1006462.1 hypothetical protein [Verrucomicrobiota bacterium]
MTSPRELFEADLHRALQAAAKAYGRDRFVVVGSAAILATHPDAPDYIRRSADIDMFPLPAVVGTDMENGDHLVGQGSKFEREHHFYVERLGDWTMLTQPAGWLERCVVVSTKGVTGYCLHPLDLAYNKTEAGRAKDILYVAGLIHEGYLTAADLENFIRSHCPHEELKPAVLENFGRAVEALHHQDGDATS